MLMVEAIQRKKKRKYLTYIHQVDTNVKEF